MAGCQLGLWNVLPIDQRKRMSTRSPGARQAYAKPGAEATCSVRVTRRAADRHRRRRGSRGRDYYIYISSTSPLKNIDG